MSDYEKPCPFCGSTNLKSGGDDKIVGTWCLDCEATGPNHYGRYEWNDRADRIEELKAKLAKAVAFLEFLDGNYRHVWGDTARAKIRALYAELKGQDDE